MTDQTRRSFLAALGTTASIAVAGCSQRSTDSNTTTTTNPETAVFTDEGKFASNQTQPTTPTDPANSPTSTKTTPEQHQTTTTPATTDDVPSPEEAKFSDATIKQAREIGTMAQQGVVLLQSNPSGRRPPRQHGTGWFYDDNHILTCAHVVNGIPDDVQLNAWTYGDTKIPVSVVDTKRSQSVDIALLEIQDDTTPPQTLSMTSSEVSLTKGQPLVEVGHPFWIGNWIISLGTYNGRESPVEPDGHQDLTARMPAKGGNSGAPLLTLDGTVVGMHWGSTKIDETPNLQKADPSEAGDTVHTELPRLEHIESMYDPARIVHNTIDDWL